MSTASSPEPWDGYARELGLRLNRHRIRLGLSQEELAYAAGITRSHYQQLEKGQSRPKRAANPSLRTLVALAGVLGVRLSELLPESEPRVTASRPSGGTAA